MNGHGPVLIVGGGIAGMTLALALSRQGIASQILERRDRGDETGAGIQLGPNATRLLIGLGLEDALAPLVARPRALHLHAKSTRPLASMPLAEPLQQRFGAPYWALQRADLARVLATAVDCQPLVTFASGFDARTVVDQPGGPVRVLSREGREASGTCVIAADGIWSSLRPLVGAAPPLFTGRAAWRSQVPAGTLPPAIDRTSVSLWMAANAHVVAYPVAAGAIFNIVVVLDDVDASPDWGRPVAAPITLAATAGLPAPARELLAMAVAWRQWPLFAVFPLAANLLAGWSRDRLLLIGDAAHPVLPFLAQGAGLAIEDAIALAALLATGRPIAEVCGAFAASRQPRTRRVAAAAENNGRIYHLTGAAAIARDTVLRLSSPAALLRRYDWLYGYTGTAAAAASLGLTNGI